MYIKEDSASAVTGTANSSSTSLTLTSGKNTASVAITPTNAGGAFATSSSANKAEFNVSTNNYTGYTLAITASDDTGNLVNTTTNGTIASITTNLTESSFDTSANNNKWGFKPSRYVSNNTVITNTGDGSVYLPSPTTTPTFLDKTNVANSTANNYTIALGIRADHNTTAGTYSKTFTLVATANPTTYTINYNQNTTDTVSNLPATSTAGSTSSITINLPNTVPTRTHYTFLGWCSTTTTTSNGIDSCSGIVYNPNGAGTNLTYGIDQTTANTTTLYAMWELEKFTITLTTSGGANGIIIDGMSYSGSSVSLAYGTHTISGSYNSNYEFSSWATSGSISVASTSSASTTLTVSGAGTLTLSGKQSLASIQSITLATCPTTATQVYDTRDNEIYTIQKLADGKCWLLDNLRLDLTNSTVLNTLSASNTNASAASLTSLRSGNHSAGNQYATAGVTNWTSSYSFSAPLIATSGSGNNGSWTKDTLQSYGSGSGKIGVYYNYCAASAGSYCYGNGSTSEGSPSGNATEDICPKGWRMPTGGSSGEYQALYTAYSSNATNFKNALRTPLSGVFGNGSAYSQGSNGNGYFWSSTYFSSLYMYSLVVDSSNVLPQNYNDRYYGFSVRCVLQASDISQISTMQDFATNNATAIKNSMTTGQAYTLTDSRDGTSYTISKLADGNVWLLDNLALDLTNSTVQANLNENTTNASNTTLGYLKGTTSRNPSTDANGNYATAGVANWTSSGYSYSAPLINTASKDTTKSYAIGQSGMGKIGVYYNYCAASAGSYCYGNGTSYSTSSGNVTEDICPAGWRMPTGGSSGEYRALLYTAYSSNGAAFVNALRTPLSGYFYGGSANLYGRGYFWSSTRNDNYRMYYLYVDASNVYTQNSDSRHYGYSVRCVLQASDISQISTMQDFATNNASAIKDSMVEGQQYTLTDTRGSKSYTVAKIGSNVWMTKNLDLAGGTTLVPASSNITSSYTLPGSSTSGFSDNNTAYVYNSNSTTCGNGSPCYSYYSYAAATAGTNPSSGEATSDICSKGWRLPTSAELTTLNNTYTTGATLTAAPFYGVYAGLYYNSSFGQDSYGFYWSSTASTSSAYYLEFSSSSGSAAFDSYKHNGLSIRCVAK